MVEKIIQQYLNSKSSVQAYMEEPIDPPEKYFLIEKTGSSTRNKTETATLAIKSYADSMYDAACLNKILKGYMEDSVSLNAISSCKLVSDYNWTDTTKKKYRYQAIFDVICF